MYIIGFKVFKYVFGIFFFSEVFNISFGIHLKCIFTQDWLKVDRTIIHNIIFSTSLGPI